MTARLRHLALVLGGRTLRRERRPPEPRARADRRQPNAVVRVDDPDGRLRILAVRGVVPESAFEELAAHAADLTHGDQVHVELTDAIIVGVHTMARLAVIADRLEARGVHVRIVGVDPDHPAIHRTR